MGKIDQFSEFRTGGEIIRCSNCGGFLKEDTKTCPACGAEVIVKQPAEAEEKGGSGIRAAKSLAGLTAKKGVVSSANY